jgi:hypothetical protein
VNAGFECGLVGFDVRAHPSVEDPCWNDERRSAFTLRDVVRPLSVDQLVWRSIFAEPNEGEWRGVLDHWSSFSQMKARAELTGLVGGNVCNVAVHVVWELLSLQERADWKNERLDQNVEVDPTTTWRLVGYDVADQWLLSGLSNCGYSVQERDPWRARWGATLNESHLFDDRAAARAFAIATNQRVREHAPFFVYAVSIND